MSPGGAPGGGARGPRPVSEVCPAGHAAPAAAAAHSTGDLTQAQARYRGGVGAVARAVHSVGDLTLPPPGGAGPPEGAVGGPVTASTSIDLIDLSSDPSELYVNFNPGYKCVTPTDDIVRYVMPAPPVADSAPASLSSLRHAGTSRDSHGGLPRGGGAIVPPRSSTAPNVRGLEDFTSAGACAVAEDALWQPRSPRASWAGPATTDAADFHVYDEVYIPRVPSPPPVRSSSLQNSPLSNPSTRSRSHQGFLGRGLGGCSQSGSSLASSSSNESVPCPKHGNLCSSVLFSEPGTSGIGGPGMHAGFEQRRSASAQASYHCPHHHPYHHVYPGTLPSPSSRGLPHPAGGLPSPSSRSSSSMSPSTATTPSPSPSPTATLSSRSSTASLCSKHAKKQAAQAKDPSPSAPRNYVDSSRSYVESPRSYADPPRNYVDPPRNYVDASRSYVDSPRNYVDSPRNYVDPSRNYVEVWIPQIAHRQSASFAGLTPKEEQKHRDRFPPPGGGDAQAPGRRDPPPAEAGPLPAAMDETDSSVPAAESPSTPAGEALPPAGRGPSAPAAEALAPAGGIASTPKGGSPPPPADGSSPPSTGAPPPPAGLGAPAPRDTDASAPEPPTPPAGDEHRSPETAPPSGVDDLPAAGSDPEAASAGATPSAAVPMVTAQAAASALKRSKRRCPTPPRVLSPSDAESVKCEIIADI